MLVLYILIYMQRRLISYYYEAVIVIDLNGLRTTTPNKWCFEVHMRAEHYLNWRTQLCK